MAEKLHFGDAAFWSIISLFRYAAIFKKDLSILYISKGLSEELGCEQDSIQNCSLKDIIGSENEEFVKAVQDAIDNKEEKKARLNYKQRGNSKRSVLVNLIPLKLEEETLAFLYLDNSYELLEMLRHERDERVKELQCLYLVSNEVKEAKSLDELLMKVTSHIRNGMQFPKICSVYIEYEGKKFSDLHIDSPIHSRILEPIFVHGKKVGEITVNYHQKEDFLKEEYALVSSIAKVLGKAGERFYLEKKRQEYTRHLEETVKERVRELKKSRLRYQLIFENAVNGVAISTREGEIIEANPAFYRMLKYPEDGSRPLHVIKDNLYRDLKDREYIFSQLDKYGRVDDYEFDLVASDGSIVTVSYSSTIFEEDGKKYCATIMKDITEKKKLERELRKQKALLEEKVKKRTEVLVRQKDKLMEMNRQCKKTSAELKNTIKKMQTLFNAITDPIFSINKDFTILMTNQSPFDIGRKCHEVLFNSEKICKRCPAIRAMKKKKPASIEIERDGRYYQLQCYPIIDENGEVDGVIEWAKDITQEKNLCDQMLQTDRLASLGQLVSGIGHEINNPNTFILGNMKIIREAFNDILPILDEYYKKHPDLKIARLKYDFFKEHISLLIDDMESGAERIKTIVQDLKKFARKSDDRFDSSVSINQIVERSIRLVRNQVKRKAKITTDLEENLPYIRANTIGLEQVLINLIINAYDALKDGEMGNIHISTSMGEDKDTIVIQVKDNGIGMDRATLRQIFNPFFTTKRAKGGTGLGLSIAYRIIKEHEGEIEVESTPGKGTTFRIEIPISPE